MSEAWKTEVVLSLRHLINDLDDDNPTFCDERLIQLFLNAAKFVVKDIQLPNVYTISLASFSISPEPDELLMNLAIAKAVCMLAQSEAKTSSGQAIKRDDYGTSISLGDIYKAKQQNAKEVCDVYNTLKFEYSTNGSINGGGVGRIIVTPFRRK